jgi:hypothetical protein
MKYTIMTFGDQSGLEGKSPEWIREMIAFMKRIDVELAESGELVIQQGLADASQGKTVKVEDGAPIVTNAPFADSRKSLAGFLDRRCRERGTRDRDRHTDRRGRRRRHRGARVHGRTARRRPGAATFLNVVVGKASQTEGVDPT